MGSKKNIRQKICASIITAVLSLFCVSPSNSAIIAVNAGHQAKADLEKEPIGPGAKIMKYKVAGGTRGVISKMPEYELNLQNAKLLEKELLNRGHKVVMIRSKNDVNLSNKERVEKAVSNRAELIINLHANAPGSKQPKNMQGIITLCRSKNNSFNKALYLSERNLAQKIQEELCKATGAADLGVAETDTMTGINWSTVPSVIVEVGYMTNEIEDLRLQDALYREKIATAIANGIESYLKSKVKQ